MTENQTKNIYWGIGLENETYLQFENSLIVNGEFIQEKIGCDRYSIDYRKCYKLGVLEPILNAGFQKNEKYKVSRMINSHSLGKLDINFQHKTLPVGESTEATSITNSSLIENPEFTGETILELILKDQPYNIQSLVTKKNSPMGPVNFDGDSIEFVTMYFQNRTIKDSCDELKASKQLFLDVINETGVFDEKLQFPDYNFGLNMFMSNQENLVLFNNGTYHFHITLPTKTINSRIIDYVAFEKTHANAIYLLQWFEPFFIATLGNPDIMGVISSKCDLENKFTLGSMRSAISRYIGIGTFHNSMPKGKILTYKVEDFRKLLKFKKEENIWWRDQIENETEYEFLSDLGLDFNQEKMHQSGFEIRSFDEFPVSYLNDVLVSILLICEHSLNLPDVGWAHDSVVWNNLVFKTLKYGYASEINAEEKAAILEMLNLLNPNDASYIELKSAIDEIVLLDEFFFKILSVLLDKYQENNVCLDLMLGEKIAHAPRWENFNKFQTEQHLQQLVPISTKEKI